MAKKGIQPAGSKKPKTPHKPTHKSKTRAEAPKSPRPPQDVHPQVVEIFPARCPACGSYERGNFKNVKRHQGNGYSVVWRNCNCSDCGQLYRVRERREGRTTAE